MTTEFRSEALTHWGIMPWVQLTLRANLVQPLQFHLFVQCSHFISAITFVSRHIYFKRNLSQVITLVACVYVCVSLCISYIIYVMYIKYIIYIRIYVYIQYIQLLTKTVRRELLHVKSLFPKMDMNIVFWFKSLNIFYLNNQSQTRPD